MWVVAAFRVVKLRTYKPGEPIVLVYNKLFYYFTRQVSLLRAHCFAYCPPRLFKRTAARVGFEQTQILFKYNGKAYRVSRKKQILYLNFHYPTFKYLVWNNIKLKHKKKRKKTFKITTSTFAPILSALSANLFRLRPLNTYTRRGVQLSGFAYYARKPKTASKR